MTRPLLALALSLLFWCPALRAQEDPVHTVVISNDIGAAAFARWSSNSGVWAECITAVHTEGTFFIVDSVKPATIRRVGENGAMRMCEAAFGFVQTDTSGNCTLQDAELAAFRASEERVRIVYYGGKRYHYYLQPRTPHGNEKPTMRAT